MDLCLVCICIYVGTCLSIDMCACPLCVYVCVCVCLCLVLKLTCNIIPNYCSPWILRQGPLKISKLTISVSLFCQFTLGNPCHFPPRAEIACQFFHGSCGSKLWFSHLSFNTLLFELSSQPSNLSW